MSKWADFPLEQEEAREAVDLVAAISEVLERSPAPLTVGRIRSGLPAPWEKVEFETLTEVIQRQVAAGVIYWYPRYRSQHDRYWAKPCCRHLEDLLCQAVEDGPLTWNDVRRRLPEYARMQSEAVLEEMLAQGRLFRHPPANPRAGPRFGLSAPDPRIYVRPELDLLFSRLEKLGFTTEQLRSAALTLLHEDEFR